MQTPLRAYHPRKNANQTAPARIMPGGATCIEGPILIRNCSDKEATCACLRAKQPSVDISAKRQRNSATRKESTFTGSSMAPPAFRVGALVPATRAWGRSHSLQRLGAEVSASRSLAACQPYSSQRLTRALRVS